MNIEIVIQFVRQLEDEKLPMSLGETLYGNGGKEDFIAMGRENSLRALTNKDRKRGGVYGEDNFDDGGERFAKP